MRGFGLLIVDDFLHDPGKLRTWALGQKYWRAEQFYGMRSKSVERYCLEEYNLRRGFENLFGADFSVGPEFERLDCHGLVWLGLEAEDPLQRPGPHTDGAEGLACVIYLTPGLPTDCGTSFWRHIPSGQEGLPLAGTPGPLDRRVYEETDRVSHKYNRAVFYPTSRLHSATRHYGTSLETGRLHTMFHFRQWRQSTATT